MSGQPSHQTSPAPLRAHLAGTKAVLFGNLPKARLPGDDYPIIALARELAEILKEAEIYRRDTLVVLPYHEKGRLEILEPEAFRSWLSRHVWTYKIKYDKEGEPYEVGKSLTKDEASAILKSWDFWPSLPSIEYISAIPMPRITAAGTMGLTTPGYDPESKTYTFAPRK